MAAQITNWEWEEGIELENDLKEQISCNLGQSEIVEFYDSQISSVFLQPEDCTGPQMIPWPEMFPKLDHKWSWTANDLALPWCKNLWN